MKVPKPCINHFCGIYYLPHAMRLVSGLLIVSSLAVLGPVTYLCHLSVIQENHFIFLSAGGAALSISIIVFAVLLFQTDHYIHFILNLLWWGIASYHIVCTIHLFAIAAVKSSEEEDCPTFGVLMFFASWFFNMMIMGAGLLVYWSTLLYLYNI